MSESVTILQRACVEAGCHDFMEPIVVRQGPHVLHGSAEALIAICRRCGAIQSAGWYGEEAQ